MILRCLHRVFCCIERAAFLAFVALVIISSFYLSSIVISSLVKEPTVVSEILVYIPIFVAIVICLKVPIFGWRLTPKALGISFEKIPEKFGWAFGAFFANIPILLIVLAFSTFLQKYFPGGGHPVGEELLSNPKPLEIAKITFMLCVVAPIWEEIFFRGLLFPAFTKVFGKAIYGALLSSFIFASIHPQGLVGVPTLMTFALMACAVSYQTKSLISNMILHALHNGAALLALLLVVPILN